MNTKFTRVLLIEDNPGDARLIQEMLKENSREKFEVHIAERLSTGVNHLAEHHPDVVVLDLGLPDSQGLATLTGVIAYADRIPVVVLTGLADEVAGQEAVRRGAQDYLSKGEVTGKTLWRVLLYAIERRRMVEDLRQSEENLRNLFENAVAGIYQTTPEGRIITANEAFAKMYGYNSSAEIISEIVDIGTQLFANKEDREELIRIVAKQGIVGSHEVKMRDRDGNTIWLDLSLRGVKDDSGKLLKIEGVCTNINARKQAEKKLEESHEKLQRTLQTAVEAIAAMVEIRDPYTAGHQVRVTKLACAIAQAMGLAMERIKEIRIAGTVHDIGKMHIPAEILSKPGKLSEIEFMLIKSHPQGGYDIVKNIEFPCSVATTVLQHHERLDGSGYPQGLKANDIILEAKILAVADVVEAMSSHRPYRPALGEGKALEEIMHNKGILYEEKVVEACVKLFYEKGFKF